MTFWLFQLAPRTRSIRNVDSPTTAACHLDPLEFSSCEKPTERLSGDQNGKIAPSVQFIGCATFWSNLRNQSFESAEKNKLSAIWRQREADWDPRLRAS